MSIALKQQRLEARISAEQKEIIARAAEISGLSLTDFVVQAAYQAAQESITHFQHWQLSKADAQLFTDTLMNPPAPNTELVTAAKRSRERFGS